MLATSHAAFAGAQSDMKSPDMAGAVDLCGDELALGLLDHGEDCIKLLSVDGHLEFMNCGGLTAMEIAQPELVLGKLWWSLWPAGSQGFVQQQFRRALLGENLTFEASCPTAKGTPRRWSVNLKPLCSKAGLVVAVIATSRKISFEDD